MLITADQNLLQKLIEKCVDVYFVKNKQLWFIYFSFIYFSLPHGLSEDKLREEISTFKQRNPKYEGVYTQLILTKAFEWKNAFYWQFCFTVFQLALSCQIMFIVEC